MMFFTPVSLTVFKLISGVLFPIRKWGATSSPVTAALAKAFTALLTTSVDSDTDSNTALLDVSSIAPTGIKSSASVAVLFSWVITSLASTFTGARLGGYTTSAASPLLIAATSISLIAFSSSTGAPSISAFANLRSLLNTLKNVENAGIATPTSAASIIMASKAILKRSSTSESESADDIHSKKGCVTS